MKKHDNYKDSGIKWIGEMSEPQIIFRLWDVADFSIKASQESFNPRNQRL
ncbi:MAG: hypothetical protein ACOCWM_01670 [Cyclobacteriaceae bacterium]